MNNHECKKGNFWFGFFLGGLIGAFIILLLGTEEGKKLARRLMQKAKSYEDELEDKVSSLHKKGEEFLEEAENVKENIIKKIETGKKHVSEELTAKMDTTLTKLEELQKKGVALTQDVHHRYFKKHGKTLTS